MTNLYHRVPKNMTGTTLYPLNVLKVKIPEVYESAIEKYIDREETMAQVVPPLNCLWNDVIHLTAVHPAKIKEALLNAGKEHQFDFYELDPNSLDPAKTCIYLYNRAQDEPKEFAEYNPLELEQYSVLSEKVKTYYSETLMSNGNPLLFHMVPHILYKGSIDISEAKVITV